MSELDVGLNSWIIQDGNYGEFSVGSHYRVALEFHGSRLSPSSKRNKHCEREGAASYKVTAEVIFCTPDVWVIDFGLKVYCKASPPNFAKSGQWVQGEIWLGIDPFFYKERLHRLPGMPDLWNRWLVSRIQLEITPWIEEKSSPGSVFRRDDSRQAWDDKTSTDAWIDDAGRADYLLTLRN